MSTAWRSYSGVLHVHTDASGGASFEDLLQAARDAKIDFIVLTDTGQTAEEMRAREGWHNGVLVLSGEEVYCSDGHFLAFETREAIGTVSNVEIGIEEVRRQVGVVVGTHYHYAGIQRPSLLPPPLPIHHVDLAELWCFSDEFFARVRGNKALQFHARPDRALMGPTREVIADWDAELRQRMVPIIGSLNAHTRKEPLLDWREFFPPNVAFKMIRTVIRCPELPKNGTRARDIVWMTLRKGQSFVYNHALGDAVGFEFEYRPKQGASHQMGDSVEYEPGGLLSVTLPSPVEVVIRCDSSPLFWGTAQKFQFPAPCAGVYRVEAYVDRRLWILSNAIRVLPGAESPNKPPTVMDFT